jgi:glucosylceramidase
VLDHVSTSSLAAVVAAGLSLSAGTLACGGSGAVVAGADSDDAGGAALEDGNSPVDASATEDGGSEAEADGASSVSVHVWLTTTDLANHLTQQPDVALGACGPADVTFDDTQTRQAIDGFGAAFTDTAAFVLENGLDASTRARVLSDLFSATQGIGLSLMRVPMAASDFTACACSYSYDDGAADPSLGGFSISHDDAYVIPVILQAQAVNPGMKLFANPWSPPAWMKTNASMLGTDCGAAGTLLQDAYAPLAQYFVDFIQAYTAAGVALWGITPQNEPDYAPATYPGMSFPADAEASFLADDLGPALTSAGLSGIRVLGGDTTGANRGFAQTLFANAATAATLYGTAWHCYSGLDDLAGIHEDRPDLPLYMTECSTGPTGIAGDAAQQVLLAMNSWASGAVLWNLALDVNGGPKQGHGCDGCTGLVAIDTTQGQYEYTINYYELGQFSEFVVPGALALAGTAPAGVLAQAFRNPGGSHVLVATNTSGATTTFTVDWGGRGTLQLSLAPAATVTLSDWK